MKPLANYTCPACGGCGGSFEASAPEFARMFGVCQTCGEVVIRYAWDPERVHIPSHEDTLGLTQGQRLTLRGMVLALA